jgi:chromosome segregation ATPase
MGTSGSARLRVKSSGFKFELEAREEFVSAEYPKLLATLGDIARALVVIRVEELGADSASAQGALTDLDREMQRLKQELDSLSELGETESLRLQMAMDRISKMMSTLSNVLKKISDTAQSITQNLK